MLCELVGTVHSAPNEIGRSIGDWWSECKEGETTTDDPCTQCYCYGGTWICPEMLCEREPEKGSDRTGIARRLKESDIVDRNIAEDTDRSKRSECKDGETKIFEVPGNPGDTISCTCHVGTWLCPWVAAKDIDRSKRSECKDGETKIFENYSCICHVGTWLCPWVAAKDTDRSKRSKCQAGETTMIECNHCFCSGGSWLCTKMGCEQGSDQTGEQSDRTGEQSARTGIARRLKESEPCLGRNDTCHSTSQCCQSGFGSMEREGCCRHGEDGIGRCHYVSCFGCWRDEGLCEKCRAEACGIPN